MSKLPTEKIREIRDRIDLGDVVGRHVALTRRGRRLIGLCPFHAEKTPSFGVSPDKQLYHCFGCQAGGDVFDFIMRIEGIGFGEALRKLAREVGVTLPERAEDPAEQRRRQTRDRLFEVNQVAASFYARCLAETPEARTYLSERRGLEDATITRFQLGWAPEGWQTLHDLLKKKGVSRDDALKIGLLGRSARSGRMYDRLRARIVFPIETGEHQIAGFGGRRADWLDPDGPKYLNSPQSPIYDKSSILYGLAPARRAIRQSRRVLLVEGYLDVIALNQAGIENVVAGCGTALASRHADQLARWVDEVVTFYDGDSAGLEAARKATLLLLERGIQVRVAGLPAGEDPDSFVREKGHDSVKKLVDEAPSAIDFFVARARFSHGGGGIAAANRALDAVKPMILAIKDPLERDVALHGAAEALGVSESVLRRHLGARRSISRAAPRIPPPTRAPALETALLRAALEKPETLREILESRGALGVLNANPVARATEGVLNAAEQNAPVDGPGALELVRDAGGSEALVEAVRAELARELPAADAVESLVDDLVRRHRFSRLEQIQRELRSTTDPKAQQALVMEHAEITRSMQRK